MTYSDFEGGIVDLVGLFPQDDLHAVRLGDDLLSLLLFYYYYEHIQSMYKP